MVARTDGVEVIGPVIVLRMAAWVNVERATVNVRQLGSTGDRVGCPLGSLRMENL
jgi:hypothetical protein